MEAGSTEVLFLPIEMADSVPCDGAGEALDQRALAVVAPRPGRDAREAPDPV